MLDRSRSSTPGRSAMRWSIVGVAVKRGDPVPLDGVDGPAGVERLEHDQPVAGEQVVERGERVDVVHRRQHEDRLRPGDRTPLLHHRRAEDLVEDRRQRAHDHLRRAGRPAAADALHAGRRPRRAGRGPRRRRCRGSTPGRRRRGGRRAPITSRSWSSSQSGRSHRTGIGVAPSFQPANAAMTSSGELRRPRANRSPTPRPFAAMAPASWLERRSSSALVSTTSRAVDADVGVERGVGLLGRQLAQPLDEAQLIVHVVAPLGRGRAGAQHGSGAPNGDPHINSSQLDRPGLDEVAVGPVETLGLRVPAVGGPVVHPGPLVETGMVEVRRPVLAAEHVQHRDVLGRLQHRA